MIPMIMSNRDMMIIKQSKRWTMLGKGLKTVLLTILAAMVISGCGSDTAGTTPGAEPADTAQEEADTAGTTQSTEPADTVEDEETSAIETTTELMDYYGQNIDDLMSDFPDLEISSEEGIYDVNGAQYIDKTEEADGRLLGPEFDVDGDFIIVGITYSGNKFTLSGVGIGMTMDEAISLLKSEGWEFSNVDYAHGTAQYIANYTKDDRMLTLVSTDEGEFGKSEESDLTGNVETVSVQKQ